MIKRRQMIRESHSCNSSPKKKQTKKINKLSKGKRKKSAVGEKLNTNSYLINFFFPQQIS